VLKYECKCLNFTGADPPGPDDEELDCSCHDSLEDNWSSGGSCDCPHAHTGAVWKNDD